MYPVIQMSDKESKIIQVEPMDSAKENSPTRHVPMAQLYEAEAASPKCYWNGVEYSVGSVVCSSGQKFRCSVGGGFLYAFWTPIGTC